MRRKELPDHIRVLDVWGAEYFIEWELLRRGSSFFIPTTATPRQVKAALKPAEAYLDITLEVRARREYGRAGVRVWRTY